MELAGSSENRVVPKPGGAVDMLRQRDSSSRPSWATISPHLKKPKISQVPKAYVRSKLKTETFHTLQHSVVGCFFHEVGNELCVGFVMRQGLTLWPQIYRDLPDPASQMLAMKSCTKIPG